MSSDAAHNNRDDEPRLHTSQPPQILRPRPRRPFELNLTGNSGSSAASSPQLHPSTPPSAGNNHNHTVTRDAFSQQLHARLAGGADSRSSTPGGGEEFKRNRSILNLTASTLFGIYQPTTGGDNGSEPATPWGTGAETPALLPQSSSSASLQQRHGGGGSGGLEWEQLRQRLGFGSGGGGSSARDTAATAAYPPPSASRSVFEDSYATVAGSEVDDGGRRASVASASSVAPQQQQQQQQSRVRRVAGAAARAAALFGFGVVYGLMISHLHDSRHMPAHVRGPEGIDRAGWGYLVFWGLAGVVVGSALPWVDLVWEGGEKVGGGAAAAAAGGKRRRGSSTATGHQAGVAGSERRSSSAREAAVGQEWNDVVRSVGAFVGIAFAIRKLPWQSTLQVSLTLALVNPALWYLLDRSKPGFTLSMLVGLTGTAIMLLLGQHADSVAFIPSPPIVGGVGGPNSSVRLGMRGGAGGGRGSPTAAPAAAAPAAAASGTASDYESTVGVATWFASVLFCSCVCFGNIGRKLAIQG